LDNDVNSSTTTTTTTSNGGAGRAQTIPTPMHLQLRRVRYQLLPAIVFTVSLALTAYLWKNYAGNPHGVGEVAALTVRVAAPRDGRLLKADHFPQVYDHVTLGQPLARFDIARLVTREEQAQEDLSRLQADLDKANAAVEAATKSGAPDRARLDDLRRQAAVLRDAVGAARDHLNSLSDQVRNATIQAPVSGKVTAVLSQPDEFVKQGQDILTITPDDGAYIVSYVRPESAIVPKKDMRVLIRNQTRRKSAVSIVQEVGTRIEPIPEHQLVNAKKPEWGIPVRIAMPDRDQLPLMPGELVVLTFQADAR
jgi:multidrug resistance efflux pump